MRQISLILVSFSLLSIPNALISGILNTPVAVPDKTAIKRPDYKWVSSSYVGYAWSLNTNLTNSNPKLFNTAANGDNTDFGNVPYAGFSLGRKISRFFKLAISYDVYGALTYRRYHPTGTAPTPAAGVEVLGIPYSRSFNLDHQGVLFNAVLEPPKQFEVVIQEMHIKPAISGGVGFGVSKVKAFQALGFDDTPPFSQITTIGATNVTKKLAWQVTAGLSLCPRNSAVSFGLAYRYYDGGKFESSDVFVLNDAYNLGLPVKLTAWQGVFRSNQIKMYINAEF